jgi:hypothetical protein
MLLAHDSRVIVWKEALKMIRRFLIGAAIAALASLAAGCASDQTSATNANANANTEAANTASTTTAPDNSEVTTTNDNGVRTETRTFRSNPRVSKVVVTTRDGNRTVKVYSPNGEEREMQNGPERALDATGDAIADSVGFVKDKSTDVGEKTVDVSKDVVDKTKEGTKTVADKTVDTSKKVADKTVDTSKTVANKTVDTTKTVADKTKSGTKTVIDKTAEGAKKTGKAIKKVITP